MKDANPFKNRHIRIVTQHNKESVIIPVFQKKLGVTCSVIRQVNTDLFGTFSGELPRQGSALDAARAKCAAGASFFPSDLIMASEGSFAPHPFIPFVYCNEELLLLTDPLTRREWKASAVTLRTNFGSQVIHSENELIAFALQSGFPYQGLILRALDNPGALIKGINSLARLKYHYRKISCSSKLVLAETDMRALFNPLRMAFIGQVARELVRLILRRCPACKTPGYAITEIVRGLPCSWCGKPTGSVLLHIYTCSACGHKSDKPFPYGKTKEDPMYCNHCNP